MVDEHILSIVYDKINSYKNKEWRIQETENIKYEKMCFIANPKQRFWN